MGKRAPRAGRRHGGDMRGSAESRRKRKQWMLDHFGNGVLCACHWCGCTLCRETVTADRIVPGGKYVRGNLVPACHPCNNLRGTSSYESFKEIADAA